MSAHEDGGAAMRAAFEAWISRPPFEKDIARFSDLDTWPGAYTSYSVHLAWDAWQAASLAARTPGETARSALSRASGSTGDAE